MQCVTLLVIIWRSESNQNTGKPAQSQYPRGDPLSSIVVCASYCSSSMSGRRSRNAKSIAWNTGACFTQARCTTAAAAMMRNSSQLTGAESPCLDARSLSTLSRHADACRGDSMLCLPCASVAATKANSSPKERALGMETKSFAPHRIVQVSTRVEFYSLSLC